MRTGLFILACASAAAAQTAPGVDDRKVREAIDRGIAWLKLAPSPGHGENGSLARNSDELILLTLIHAGVPQDDPRFRELLERILIKPLERTYNVALQAVCLEEIGRVRYQPRIAQCAQFLIDNQCTNGQWTYGEPTPAAVGTPPEGARPAVASSAVRAPGLKPKVDKRLAIARTKTGPASGDNSNSQYAALGLRACHDAGVIFPRDTAYLAVKALREGQRPKGDGKGGTPTGLPAGAAPRGWCYHSPGTHKAYSSMTAGAVGALVIYDYILGREWKKDSAVNDGLAWLAVNFTVTENRGCEFEKSFPSTEHFYYLYALERAGILYGTEKIGENLWYAEGARVILAAQAADGSWSEAPPEKSWSTPTWDTCFAILFLRRATQPLTPSVDRFNAPQR